MLNPVQHDSYGTCFGHIEGVKGNDNGKNCRVKTRPVPSHNRVGFAFAHTPPYAFTLSETLIALVIIGIVAALCVPILMENYTRKTVETRLQKFYTTMNSAIRRAEVDFGDKKDWFFDTTNTTKAKEWFDKYLAPYLVIIKSETNENGTFIVYFNDGSALEQAQAHTTRDWYYYPGSVSKCKQQDLPNGACRFSFVYCPEPSNTETAGTTWKYHYNKGFEPCKYNWDGTKEQLYSTGWTPCKTANPAKGFFCTAIIQENGWKIPSDYPRKIKI